MPAQSWWVQLCTELWGVLQFCSDSVDQTNLSPAYDLVVERFSIGAMPAFGTNFRRAGKAHAIELTKNRMAGTHFMGDEDSGPRVLAWQRQKWRPLFCPLVTSHLFMVAFGCSLLKRVAVVDGS